MMVKFKKTFSAAKSCLKHAKAKIYLFCLHIWDQRSVLEDLCTDGAPSVVAFVRGFTCFVKKESPGVVTTHWFLRSEVLGSKVLGDGLKKVLNVATKMVNFMEQRPVHSRMLKKL
jgi:hypothetical protein